MDLVRGLHNLMRRPRGEGSSVTIGNFDGVHLGHQALVRAARARATALGVPCTVLTFEPLPREFFDRDGAPPRLMRIGEKLEALAAIGVDRVVVARFDARLQRQRPSEFVEQMLVEALRARHVVVGEGFRYAVQREGTVETLRADGARLGFGVEAVPAVLLDGDRVSSTRVRAALAFGDLRLVRRLLGRDFRLSGRVIRGRQLGRQLGYATANMRLPRRPPPLAGIYAVRVAGIPGEPRDGVASLGTRPTVDGVEPLLETHLFDFAGDLYGRRLHVDFVARIRAEARFESLDALVAQMHDDAARARAILAEAAA